MKIVLVTPAGKDSRNGNRNTALRWAGMLRELGHKVRVQVEWDGAAADLMLALHARRSHASIEHFHAQFPQRPLLVTLTGTDLYRDIRSDAGAQLSLERATRLIVLQDQGVLELRPALRAKTRVVYQSAVALRRAAPLASRFEVCVIGHLREEKDPFRCALAAPLLPEASRIAIVHMGRALSAEAEHEARQHMASEPRYRWLGELAHWRVRRYLARSRLLVVSSRMEGGANVVSEALAAGLPIIASRISGNVGMLGADYAGLYPVADEAALAELLWRAESDPAWYRGLKSQCAQRKHLASPAAERASLKRLIAELD